MSFQNTNTKREIIRQISDLLFEKFVINLNAAGIQQEDGRYITKYVPVSSSLIENMILSDGSMGCYQQGYRTGNIKWICFDFDCKDKQNPNLEELDEEINRLTSVLEKLNIRYLKEFSGRRGIHVWITFNSILKKEIGYKVLQGILKLAGMESFESENWGLDLFPATDSPKGNKVGKQVKFPLSCHKTGARSFFFIGSFSYSEDVESVFFFSNQLAILTDYTPNDWRFVIKTLGIETEYERAYDFKFKQYRVLDSLSISTDDVIRILSQTNVFRMIFSRMKTGHANSKDWIVLLGTLSHCDENANLLRSLYQEFPNYDESLTLRNIARLKDYYYPATFGYLYQIYGIEIEDGLNPNDTGFSYLLMNLGIDYKSISTQSTKKLEIVSEVNALSDISNTVRKEQVYLLDNDEAPDIYYWNSLQMFSNFDKEEISQVVDKVKTTGHCEWDYNAFRVFNRIESEEKTRKMVSLSAYDRVITTHLAVLFFYEFRKSYKNWNSYSYLPSLTSKKDVFFPWYYSWTSFIRQLKSFLEVPFFKNYSISYVDLKGFYDHVDFVVVSDYVLKHMEVTSRNLLNGLIEYNDYIMTNINSGIRTGVPQGPAYARIIAEVFLNIVLDEITLEYRDNIYLYRYVDDIIIIGKPGFDIIVFYNSILHKLENKGLPVNEEKSQCYGLIGSLSEAERRLILHKDSFNNYLRNSWDDHILLDEEKKGNLLKHIENNVFDIGFVGLFFSAMSSDVAKKWCFEKYGKEIIKSKEGRGSNYKRFYQYLLSDIDLIEEVLSNGWLELMPLDSLNFSNFISVVYLLLQKRTLKWKSFLLLRNCFLAKIKNRSEISINDRIVLDSLLEIRDVI